MVAGTVPSAEDKMEERVKFDPEVGKFRIEYFFLDDPNKLPNNLNQVMRKV